MLNTIRAYRIGVLGILALLGTLAVVGLLLFRMLFVNFVENYALGYRFDRRTGEVTLLNRTGYFVTPPFVVKVYSVDLRPMQVCINANSRVLNCKLVKFNPAGLKLFLSWHGLDDYDGGSSTLNDKSGVSGFNQILMSYAYDGSGRTYPFLQVLRELKSDQNSDALDSLTIAGLPGLSK